MIPNKAVGEDEVANEMVDFENPRPRGRQVICLLANLTLLSFDCPAVWRNAILIPLLKPGKHPELSISYRPISLCSQLGNFVKRLIESRLHHFLESFGALHASPAGFRAESSTTENITESRQNLRRNAVSPEIWTKFHKKHPIPGNPEQNLTEKAVLVIL